MTYLAHRLFVWPHKVSQAQVIQLRLSQDRSAACSRVSGLGHRPTADMPTYTAFKVGDLERRVGVAWNQRQEKATVDDQVFGQSRSLDRSAHKNDARVTSGTMTASYSERLCCNQRASDEGINVAKEKRYTDRYSTVESRSSHTGST